MATSGKRDTAGSKGLHANFHNELLICTTELMQNYVKRDFLLYKRILKAKKAWWKWWNYDKNYSDRKTINVMIYRMFTYLCKISNKDLKTSQHSTDKTHCETPRKHEQGHCNNPAVS